MTTGWKYDKISKERLLALEEPGKALLFDADKGLVEDITQKFDMAAAAGSLQGKDEKEALKESMGLTHEELIAGWLRAAASKLPRR
jgi:hypothetical protein